MSDDELRDYIQAMQERRSSHAVERAVTKRVSKKIEGKVSKGIDINELLKK